jgi:ABC-2 type transport system ATP-binding protein
VSFSNVPQDWLETLKGLPDVESVVEHEQVYRIASDNGPRTTVELVETARRAGVEVASLSVKSTTLDDVFTHYTGRQLRDELQSGRYDVSFMYQKQPGL